MNNEKNNVANYINSYVRKYYNSDQKIMILGNGDISKETYKILNQYTNVDVYSFRDNKNKILSIIKDYDIIIDCIASKNEHFYNFDFFKNLKENAIFIHISKSTIKINDLYLCLKKFNKNIKIISDTLLDNKYTLQRLSNFKEVILTEHIAYKYNEPLSMMR